MSVTQANPNVPTTPPPAWGSYKSSDEANKAFKLLPEDMGYVLRIEDISEPSYSPFVDLDDKGQPKPPAIQCLIKFTVVDYGNDPGGDETFIGQTFTQFYRISMHAKANFYKLAKAAFGGEVDPKWKPNRPELMGRYVGAVIKHKDPNDQGQVYPKLETVTPYRGRTNYDDVSAVSREAEPVTETEPVPF